MVKNKKCFWHKEYPNGRVVLNPYSCQKCRDDLKGYYKYDKKTLCEKQSKFLFWEYTFFDHDWRYKNKKERICFNCDSKEIYFGIDDGVEDWRLIV